MTDRRRFTADFKAKACAARERSSAGILGNGFPRVGFIVANPSRPAEPVVAFFIQRGKIGAKIVSHDRYVTFQLAAVSVPRALFRKILRLIDELRPRPAPWRRPRKSTAR